MASLGIHLAVAKVYLDHFPIQNQKEFISGILDPDLVQDKDISHYTDKERGDTLESNLKTKVNLKRYLEENDISSDYQKGVFLHLLTDYEFFNHFFDIEYIRNVPYNKYCDDLYHSYDLVNEWVEKTYPVEIYDYKQILDEKIRTNQAKHQLDKKNDLENILPIEKLKLWIEELGRKDLLVQAKSILES